MTEIKTARERLAYIEKTFFKGAGLAKASLLEGEERRSYVLSQVDRLLTEKHGYELKAGFLSDMFWTADEGRNPFDKPNPLATLAGQQTLTEKEMDCLRLIVKVAGLCHDLILHFKFDLKEAFGIKNNYWVSNKKLVEWLTTTEYEHIAMHVAFTMKKQAIIAYEDGHYMPAQDALAELFSSKYRELIMHPTNTKLPPRDYVRTILDEMLRIERHWQRGRRLKLDPEVVILHDEIYGFVPRRFDKGVLEAAQALFEYMDKEVYGTLKDADKKTTAEVLGRFVDKVREVRSQYFAEGWLNDDSLEFGYLMAHAEVCGRGWWREEVYAL
jgi:hypothetical protein